jgi:hypothetical protein
MKKIQIAIIALKVVSRGLVKSLKNGTPLNPFAYFIFLLKVKTSNDKLEWIRNQYAVYFGGRA